MTRTAKRTMFHHHSRPAWQLAALLLAALVCLPSIPLAQSAPSTPASVTVTRADGMLTATWPAVSGATKYHVTYTSNNKQSWSLAALDHTTTSITISGDNAKTYIVGVRAGNDDDWSDWRDSAPAGPYTPPAPGPVASVTVTRADGTLTATWPAVSGATKYHVTYTSNNKQSWSLAALSHTTTSLTINAADNAKTYVVGVRAGNDNDDWSDWRDSPASGPYTPPGLIVQDANGNPITALAVPEGGEASYQVKLATQPTEDVEVCIGLSVQPNNDTDITFKGQASDVVALKLTFTPENWNTAQTATLVAAEDNDDVNGARAVVNDARDYYSGKVDLTATEVDNDQLTVTATRGNDGDTAGVSWTAYAGEGFEYYRVIVCNASQYDGSSCSGTVFTSTPNYDANDTGPVNVTGLSAGTGYGIILQVWRNGSALKRHATLPAGPAAPANLSVTVGDGYLDIAWDAVTGATGYDVRAKSAGSSSWHSVASNVSSASYRYATTETMDYVAVRARNANGPGNWTALWRGPAHDWLNVVIQGGASSSSAQAQSQLAAPASVTVTRENHPRDEKLYVTWTTVSGAGGYNLACAASPDDAPMSSWSWWHCGSVDSGSTTTFTVDEDRRRGLRRDLGKTRSYAVAVRAVTADPTQASPWLVSDDAHPAYAPDLATMSVSRAAGSVSVSWKRPDYAQGYKIYCATYENNAPGTYTLCAEVETATATNGRISATIKSWTAGGNNYTIDDTKAYALSVSTTNAWGESYGASKLIHPIILTVSNITWYTARLTLSNYPGDWYYQANTGPDSSCTGPVTALAKDLAGLNQGGTYTYSAYSDNRCENLLITADAFTTHSLAVTNIAQTTATVTLNGYAGNWYYQADTGPDAAACKGPITGATAVNLANLSAGTPYTYRAYDNNTCLTTASGGTASELAYALFTTIEITLTASNVTGAGATLTIANHSGDWYYQHSGQGATCQGPVAGNSQSLTTLTAGTYTYSAYSDSGCGTLLATAAAFTLGQHHVSSLTSAKADGAVININYEEAVAFTTGGNAGGYTLTSVTLPLRVPTTVSAVGPMVITLHEMEGSAAYGTGSVPSDTVLATLSGTDPTGAKWADTTYTCSGNGCSLSANTTYFVVASNGRGEYAWAYTTTNPHPEHTYPANSGWDIGYGHSKVVDRDWSSYSDWHPIRIDFTTDAGGTGTAQTAPVVAATATVRGTASPLNPAGAVAQAADRAGNAASAHKGSSRHEAVTASATRSPGYVTNLASAQSGDSDIDATQRQAVAFTTGPSPGGYTLKRFTAALRKVSGNAALVLTLHAMASTTYGDDSQPSPTVLATLAGTAPASGAYTDVTYACSGAGCILQPDTTYFVVAESSGDGTYAWAYVAAANLYTETTVPSGNGWTLGAGHYSDNGGGWTSWGDWHHARLDFETHPVLSVGNLAEAPHPDACFPSGDTRCAVGFTTGSAPGGYTLRALTARFEDADDPDGMLGDLVVTLHADNAGLPGQSLATLHGDNPTEAGDYTYTCSGAGCALKPNTTYFVQVSATAGEYLSEAYAWSATLSDHETAIPSGNGWTLANGTTAYRSTWQTYPDVGLLAIFATP